MNIPQFMQAGDTLAWRDSARQINDVNYTAGVYTLSYAIRGPSVLDVTAVTSGDQGGWETTITGSASADLLPGRYRWSAYLTDIATGLIRVTAGMGDFYVRANVFAQTAGATTDTFAQAALKAAEQALADFTSSGGKPQEYSVGDKKFRFATVGEIYQALQYWNAVVTSETAQEQLQQGLGNPRRAFLRFG